MIDKYLQTDHEGLVKDPSSGAVLNVDYAALDAYKKKKNFYKSQQIEQKRIDKIENDVVEIKHMLQQLLKRS